MYGASELAAGCLVSCGNHSLFAGGAAPSCAHATAMVPRIPNFGLKRGVCGLRAAWQIALHAPFSQPLVCSGTSHHWASVALGEELN